MDHDSLRANSFAKELLKKDWKIIVIYINEQNKNYTINNKVKSKYIHKCKNIEECLNVYKLYLGTPIHLFSRASSPLVLNFIRAYPLFCIYDPIEFIYKAVRSIDIRDFFNKSLRQKIRTLLVSFQQKLTLKHAKNIICRDMQLSNSKLMSKNKKIKTYNILLKLCNFRK